MNTIDFTPIFQALITVLATIITTKLIPWLQEHMTEERMRNIKAAAKSAVYAAEQIYGANKEANERKLDYAIERMREKGLSLDVTEIREAIECAVREMKLDDWMQVGEN